jgi:hypothetical protein
MKEEWFKYFLFSLILHIIVSKLCAAQHKLLFSCFTKSIPHDEHLDKSMLYRMAMTMPFQTIAKMHM